jgi:hypothetical protein
MVKAAAGGLFIQVKEQFSKKIASSSYLHLWHFDRPDGNTASYLAMTFEPSPAA